MVVMDAELLIMNVVANLNARSFTAEKSRAKASSRQQQQPQQRVPAKAPSAGGRVPAPAEAGGDEQSQRKDHVLQRLRELLAAGNRKFEAIAVVLQWTLAEVRPINVLLICLSWKAHSVSSEVV